MREWTNAVETKARIIHEQLAAAHGIAERNGADVAEITRPYLELLESLYNDELAFAKLMDTSEEQNMTPLQTGAVYEKQSTSEA